MTARVLVVDDDEDIRSLVRITLELADYDVIAARDGVEGLELARTQSPDVILLDVMMPRMDGMEALAELRSDGRTSHLPILLLTARAQADQAVKGLNAGADDYITKPFNTEELAARVQAAVRRTGQQRARNPLTGLPGNERILAELTERLAADEPTALLYVDLDAFKPYNDYYGFLRGDAALRTLAELLTTVCIDLDDPRAFVGHVGGDDFVVLVDPDFALLTAQRICERFDALAPELYDPEDRSAGSIEVPDRRGVVERFGLLSLSIGIASTARGTFRHHGELVTLATEMKRFAKSRSGPGSRFAADRRADGEDLELEVDLPES